MTFSDLGAFNNVSPTGGLGLITMTGGQALHLGAECPNSTAFRWCVGGLTREEDFNLQGPVSAGFFVWGSLPR